MPSVYLVTIHSLLHLAYMQKNQVSFALLPDHKNKSSPSQRVLIHSATGGVGIAAIQLCQYIGAEVSVYSSLPLPTSLFPSSCSLILLKFSPDLRNSWHTRQTAIPNLNLLYPRHAHLLFPNL
jgi:hypothetical protein